MHTILVSRKAGMELNDIALLLERNDISILMAETGPETIKQFCNHQETDMVLISVDLPTINGFDTTLMIRQLNKDIPIILFINYSNHESLRLATMVGCSGVIQNPVDPEEMLGLVVKYLNENTQKTILQEIENI
ncbi:MAG: response regulator [Bacteroidota bacterium]